MSHHEAFEQHEPHNHPAHTESSKTCRVCKSAYSHEHNPSRLGICEKCGFKILIILFIVMITVSYVAWFGVF